MAQRQNITEKLIILLHPDELLTSALKISLQKAQQPGIASVEDFYDYLDSMVTHIPTERELMPSVREFYFILSKSPGDILRHHERFNQWVNEFTTCRGNFMDSTASAENLHTFINNPEYKVEDYIKGPSGWQTYNQFLARQLKAGNRPVAGLCDDNVIVSPADSEFRGNWPIKKDSTITVKGNTYSISALLNDSSYRDKFEEGVFTHSFLSITDYHRYHMPVSGIVREVKKVAATTWVSEVRKPDGMLENIDDVGFQFFHTRGYIIIESPVGLVAVMPVGMGHISSVTFTVEENVSLVKGEEFGYFAFGGSDIIMLFQQGMVEFIAETGKHYKKGEQVATAIGRQ